MKKDETVAGLLDRITNEIITYEPGDVMKVSAISELLDELCEIYSAGGYGKKICVRLQQLVRTALRSSFADFSGPVSEGIDLLRTSAGSSVSEGKRKQVEAWLAGQPEQENPYAPADVRQKPEDDPAQIDGDQLQQFVSDCRERLTAAQELILRIEEDPEDSDAVKELFRIFHTIKGECGFLKLSRLGTLAHNAESLLDELRSGSRKADNSVINILLEGLDLAGGLVKALGNGDFGAYADIPLKEFITELVLFLKGCGIKARSTTARTEDNPDRPEKAAGSVRKSAADDTVIKVKTGKVNYLTDMIGELLICLGQMKDDTEGLPQVRKIARSLQYAGMQLRTESVHALFCTVRRIIRDTSQKLGKEVRAVFRGEDLEIDRTLIESLEEPLMHLVRNALDHGIESTEDRIAAGKSPEGTVCVTAERRGNTIVISVGDDGRGLDRAKILEKAVGKHLIREKDVSSMSDIAVNNLIFISGFSTNDTVDQISGRGVGMDIVKEAVAQAKGHIVTESIPGKGTTFSLYFPLSTAIIDGMLTRTGKNIFIIPIASIIESLKVRDGQIHKVAEGIDVLDLRGKMIPVLRMAEVFGIPEAGSGNIATVVETGEGQQFALMNDALLAKREVVIKSLGTYLKNMKGISSGTVLSGGAIGYVLDIEQVVELGKGTGAVSGVFYG